MAETATDFMERISKQPSLNRKVNIPMQTMLVSMATAVVTATIAFYKWKADERKVQRLPQEQQLKFMRRKFMLSIVAESALAVSVAVWVYSTHRPSADETSLAILLKYMHLKGDLTESVYTTIKNFKPHNMHELNI